MSEAKPPFHPLLPQLTSGAASTPPLRAAFCPGPRPWLLRLFCEDYAFCSLTFTCGWVSGEPTDSLRL